MRNSRWWARFAILAAPLVALVAIAMPAGAVSAPFTAPNVNATTPWCPNFHADNGGCSADGQTQTFETVPYQAANVTVTGKNGYINLAQTSTGGAAVNTQTVKSWSSPATIGETLLIPCNGSGVPTGWGAFWTDSAPGASGGGEMDVAETLDNSLKWGIHIGSIALPASGNAYPDKCGVHDFKVVWDSTKAAFYEDGVWQGKETPADVVAAGGAPGTWITASQRIITDYGRCGQSWCNPGGSGTAWQIQGQWSS